MPSPVQVIAVASGKGGVGKTTVSINLAMAMTMAGRRTVLLDGDLGLANVDVMLGLSHRLDLSHVVAGICKLEDILVESCHGLRVIPASSGTTRMADLKPAEQAGIIHSFSELATDIDVLVVDLAAGISSNVLTFAQAAQEVLVILCDEPASITDAYALMKVLSRERGITSFRVLANTVRSVFEGERLFDKLSKVSGRFLDVRLSYVGAIPYDPMLRKSSQLQRAVVDAFPGSPSAIAFKKLAESADSWPVPDGPRGRLEFFVEQLVKSSPRKEVIS